MLLIGLVAVIQPAKANPQFVTAYTYPANNGNAIASIAAYFDSVFNATMYYDPVERPNDTGSTPIEVELGVNITLAVFCWLNATDLGISTLSEGLAIMRHNVTVICNNGTTVFSQQNFTYIVGTDANAPMYFYRHDVILDFTPIYDQYYTVIVVYELYW